MKTKENRKKKGAEKFNTFKKKKKWPRYGETVYLYTKRVSQKIPLTPYRLFVKYIFSEIRHATFSVKVRFHLILAYFSDWKCYSVSHFFFKKVLPWQYVSYHEYCYRHMVCTYYFPLCVHYNVHWCVPRSGCLDSLKSAYFRESAICRWLLGKPQLINIQ